MKKKVAIVGTAGLPAAYGGFETLAQNLVEQLGSRYDFIVYCKRTPRNERQSNYRGARLIYLPFHSNGWQSLPFDATSLIHALSTADVILYLGPVAGLMLPLNRIFSKNLILNFGGFNEWEREKFSTFEKKYMFVSYWVAANSATNSIADNAQLQDSLKRAFHANSVVIRYGGDHTRIPENDPELDAKYPFVNAPYFISVARAQVDNNLHIMIDAFRQMPEKRLVLVSNWSVSEYGRELFEQNQNISNVSLVPAVYDARHLNYIRGKAKAYIHSHSYCGTAPSLVEAICLGLPIISWDVPTNRETTKGHAMFFNSAESLRQVVGDVTDSDLNAIRDALRPLATNEYTWRRISEQYAELFDNNTISH